MEEAKTFEETYTARTVGGKNNKKSKTGKSGKRQEKKKTHTMTERAANQNHSHGQGAA